MNKDKRKSPRRHMRYSAWIAAKPGELRACALSDISESGARIDVDDSKTIPDRFQLFLSSNGAARRSCTVVWRKGRQIGVSFGKKLAAADHAVLVPTVDSAPLAPEPDAGEPEKAETK